MGYSLSFLMATSIAVMVSASIEESSDYKDCSTALSTLEDALYKTGGNKVALNAYFFPPREESVPYAKITYLFENKNGTILASDSEEERCKVTYVWAVGGFLLIQPPSIFMFSSLFFFHTRQKNFTLQLRLPHDCRPLVMGRNGTCSCANRDNNPLDILNQQIQEYARFNNPKMIKLGTDILTQAVCYDELDKKYLDRINTRVYLAYTLCCPLIVITMLIVIVRSLSVPITARLSNSRNHPNVAGLVLTGVFFHLFSLALDAAAVYFMHADRELQDLPHGNAHHSLNFYATWITLSFNMVVSLLLLLSVTYLHCQQIFGAGNGIFKHLFQRVFSPLFYMIFGEFDHEDFWETVRNYEENGNPENGGAARDVAKSRKRQHDAWIVCLTLLAPLFSLASHTGYVFAAWLTEPFKATSAALVTIGMCVLVFLMFRQCYTVNKGLKLDTGWKSCFVVCYPCFQAIKCLLICLCLFLFRKQKFQGQNTSYETLLEEKRDTDQSFDTKAFFVTFIWGLPLMGSVAFLLSAFYELPVASYTLPLYLLNAFQVFIVVVTLMITYKILQITEPVVHVFLRNLKKAYLSRAEQRRVRVAENSQVRMEGDEVESTGTLMGELAEVVVHELQKNAELLPIRTPPQEIPA